MALAAAETVGLALGLSRAAYGDVGETGQYLVVDQDWTAASPIGAAGRHAVADFGPYIEALRRGDDVVVADVATDSRTAESLANFQALGIAPSPTCL